MLLLMSVVISLHLVVVLHCVVLTCRSCLKPLRLSALRYTGGASDDILNNLAVSGFGGSGPVRIRYVPTDAYLKEGNIHRLSVSAGRPGGISGYPRALYRSVSCV